MPGHDEVVGGHGGEDEHVGAEEAEEGVVAPLRRRDHAGVEFLESSYDFSLAKSEHVEGKVQGCKGT